MDENYKRQIDSLRALVQRYQLRLNSLSAQYAYVLDNLSECQQKYDTLLTKFNELQETTPPLPTTLPDFTQADEIPPYSFSLSPTLRGDDLFQSNEALDDSESPVEPEIDDGALQGTSQTKTLVNISDFEFGEGELEVQNEEPDSLTDSAPFFDLPPTPATTPMTKTSKTEKKSGGAASGATKHVTMEFDTTSDDDDLFFYS